MLTFSKHVGVVGLLGVIACFASVTVADDAADIKLLVPTAASMPRADFDEITHNPGVPITLDRFKDQNLTLHVLMMKAEVDDDVAKDFSFFENRAPRPSDFAEELVRSSLMQGILAPRPPATAIHADRIKSITCAVDGDRVTGDVVFEAPELFHGRAEYTATRVDGKWRIDGLAIPSRGVHLARGADGLWKPK